MSELEIKLLSHQTEILQQVYNTLEVIDIDNSSLSAALLCDRLKMIAALLQPSGQGLTKQKLVDNRDEILKKNIAIIRRLKDPWEIAHQNAATIYELSRLIDKYTTPAKEQ